MARFLSLIYGRLMQNADAEQRDAIDTALNAGLSADPEEESAEEYEARAAAEMAQFNRLKAMQTGG